MNHSLIRRIICALVLLAALGVPGLFAQLETQAAHDARLQWWRDARFGLFIHWGLYAVPAGEWDGKTIYGEWEKTWTDAYGRDLYRYVRSLQADIIINNRVGASRSGMEGFSKDKESAGDFGTPEQTIPATGLPGLDWETCMTMNDNWGYNNRDKAFKPVRTMIRMLADIASKGGNYLLNVGPTAEGVFPPESVERLKEIGAWMTVNGESIYGTLASPFKSLAWGRSTQKAIGGGVRLYLHVFDWPADGKLVVPGILNSPKKAYLLSDAKKAALTVSRREDSLVVSLPAAAPDANDSVVVLGVAGKIDVAKQPIPGAAPAR